MSLDYEIERYAYICLKDCFGGIVICIFKSISTEGNLQIVVFQDIIISIIISCTLLN